MASDSLSEARAQAAKALASALDAIEARLDALAPGADPDRVEEALAEPVRALEAAAKETLG